MVNFCKFGDGFDPIAFPTWVASQRGSPATWRQAHSASLVWTWMPLRWQEHPGKGCRNGSDSLFADLKNLKFGSCLMFSVHYPTSKSTQFHICLTEEDWRWWSPLTDSIMICSISGWKPASIGWKENREQKWGCHRKFWMHIHLKSSRVPLPRRLLLFRSWKLINNNDVDTIEMRWPMKSGTWKKTHQDSQPLTGDVQSKNTRVSLVA